MRAGWLFPLALLATPADARETLGIHDGWGAFRDSAPLRCFAIARPVRGDGFASVAHWPRAGLRGQLHIRLSRPRGANAQVTLSVGERRFELVAGERDAWAADARADAAIIAAMRSARAMSIEALGRGGEPFADTYALRGAATAIDTAALGCL